MNGKEDVGRMPFVVYCCVNAATQADCKGAVADGRLMTGSSAGAI